MNIDLSTRHNISFLFVVLSWLSLFCYSTLGEEFTFTQMTAIQNVLLISFFVFLLFSLLIIRFDQLSFPPELIAMGLFLPVAIFSIAFSSDPAFSFSYIKYYPFYIITMVVIINLRIQIKYIMYFLLIVYCINLIIIASPIFVHFEFLYGAHLRDSLKTISAAQNLNNHLLNLIIGFPTIFYFFDKTRRRKFLPWIYIGCGLLFVVLAIMYESRILVGIFGIIIVLTLLLSGAQPNQGSKAIKYLSIGVFCTALPLLIFLPTTRLVSSTVSLILDPAGNSRGIIYLHLFDLLKNPGVYLHGIGFSGFRLYVSNHPLMGLSPPHNFFLKVLVETGIIGFISFTGAVALTLRRSLSVHLSTQGRTSIISFTIFISLVGVSLFLMFEPLVSPMLVYILFGLPYLIQKQLYFSDSDQEYIQSGEE